MAQTPDISSILAALGMRTVYNTSASPHTDSAAAQQQPAPTPQIPTPQQQPPPAQAPPGYPPAGYPTQPPSAPPQNTSYLPQPTNSGSVDLSNIRPVNSGSVSIQDAIAKAKSIAADRGVSYDPRPQSGESIEKGSILRLVLTMYDEGGGDPRLAGRGYSRERSRSPPRRDTYSSNPYRDERREDPRRGGGGYRGRSPSPDSSFRGARDSPMGYRANDGETETIRVKSSLVGLIIGRNGENLRKVESESGARVQFIQAKDSHVSERQCTISGSLRARENAKAAIFGIIEENGGQNVMLEKGAYTPGMSGRAKPNLPALREGENSTQLFVPDKTVGLIIGRGGEQIKQLQEQSGCHVNIVGENKSVNGLRPVNLIGNERATAIAKDLILEIVESDTRGSGNNQQQPDRQRTRGYDNYGNGNNSNRGGQGGADWIEKTIQVPSEAVGMIIGKGGETIKDLQRTSGCKINVNSPKPPDKFRNIDLAGSARSMAEAERVIWDKVRTVQERDAAAGRGGGGGRGSAQGGGQDYGGYSQQPSTAPAVPGYGSYQPTQAPPSIPGFQMPTPQGQQQQQQPQQSSDQNDPYAAWGGQAAYYAQWYQQMAQLQQRGQQPGGGAPGTQ